MIYIVVQQKPTQHCKAVILQLKINFKKYTPRHSDLLESGIYIFLKLPQMILRCTAIWDKSVERVNIDRFKQIFSN